MKITLSIGVADYSKKDAHEILDIMFWQIRIMVRRQSWLEK